MVYSLCQALTPNLNLENNQALYNIKTLDGFAQTDLNGLAAIAVDVQTGLILEVSSNDDVMNFPSDEEIMQIFSTRYQNSRSIEILPNFLWKKTIELRSRFCFVKAVSIDLSLIHI